VTRPTPCIITINGHRCDWPSHVILFAVTSADFAGQPTHRGDILGLCLRHGEDVYNARRGRWAEWLKPYPLDTLPAVRLSDHRTVTPRPELRRTPWQQKINRPEQPTALPPGPGRNRDAVPRGRRRVPYDHT
jgi:hypothetical protein